ncbi:MAG: NAD-dependent epimerase/dehydratase family protein [Candidatus Heimdallarchaeota archaeon]
MSKVFVTGASGQVGRQVVEYLLHSKKLGITSPKDIICLVRTPEKSQYLTEFGVTVVKGDLQDSDTIFEIMNNGIEYVFHVAANCLINQTYDQVYGPNVLGTRIMLEAFVQSSAKCFVYTSSISVYSSYLGKDNIYFIDENYPLGSLTGDPYAISKRISEGLVSYYGEIYPKKEFIVTRLGPIIGPGEKQLIPSLVEVLTYKFLPKFVNGGKDYFSVTAAYDVARAQVFLAERGSEVNGQAFNIARDPTTFREMMKVITNYYNRKQPKFSIKYWFLKAMLPLLKVLCKIFPNFKLLKTAMSRSNFELLSSNGS